MTFVISLMGVNVTDVFTPPSTTTGTVFNDGRSEPPFALGTRAWGNGNAEWVYLQASATITAAGYICVFDNAGVATMVTTAVAAANPSAFLAVAPAAMAAGDYGWFQVRGNAAPVRTAASIAAGVVLYTTTTAGQAASTAATNWALNGITLQTATGGSAAVNQTGRLNYPYLAAAAS